MTPSKIGYNIADNASNMVKAFSLFSLSSVSDIINDIEGVHTLDIEIEECDEENHSDIKMSYDDTLDDIIEGTELVDENDSEDELIGYFLRES